MAREIEFDPAKDLANRKEHNLSLAQAKDFDFSTALQVEDTRKDYKEIRTIALGYIGNRLHVLIYTMRGEILRPISLRKANARERKRYAS
ncbi:MAG: BrnT family toxin [Rickettsiales bacterium]